MSIEPTQQADLLVNILAKIHDSASIVQSNQHAANEALQTLEKARAEAAEVRAATSKLKEDTDTYWRQKAKEIEEMTALAVTMRAQAQADYNAHVAKADSAGKEKYDAWVAKAKDVEVSLTGKYAELQQINSEVSNAQAVLDNVKGEIRTLRERLNV